MAKDGEHKDTKSSEEMTTSEAGRMGGHRVRELVEEGKQHEHEHHEHKEDDSRERKDRP